jgi:hypothetical protein
MDFDKDGNKNTYMGRKTLVLFYHWLIQQGRVKPKGAAYRRMIDIQRGDKVQAQWLTIRRDIENAED